MRILIIGSGGREHALAWTLSQSPQKPTLFITPGNAGTAVLGENVPIQANDIASLLDFAQRESIDLTVVGPEVPLVEGLVDRFEEVGLRVVGPSALAARLEGSKAYSKAFMQRHGIPTAAHRTFAAEQFREAVSFVEEQGAPIVIKASGLAAGKGAIVCETVDEARTALEEMMQARTFGDAGDEVVVEAFMVGEEASIFVLTDGQDYLVLAPAQDHKRIGDGDVGPNTGGMGAYAPAPVVTDALMQHIRQDIIEPTLAGMRDEGCPYRGILYVGLMMTEDGPKVVEYNCRLGDPEAQVVLPLIKSDLVEILDKLAARRLKEVDVVMHPGAAACVVMASAGYPRSYEKGFPIEGLTVADALDNVVVFQAGTRRDEQGRVVTAGGRVLGVTARGEDLANALDTAYRGVEAIRFDGAQYRRDIGQKGLSHLAR